MLLWDANQQNLPRSLISKHQSTTAKCPHPLPSFLSYPCPISTAGTCVSAFVWTTFLTFNLLSPVPSFFLSLMVYPRQKTTSSISHFKGRKGGREVEREGSRREGGKGAGREGKVKSRSHYSISHILKEISFPPVLSVHAALQPASVHNTPISTPTIPFLPFPLFSLFHFVPVTWVLLYLFEKVVIFVTML